MPNRSGRAPCGPGVSVKSKVLCDFDIGQTPVGRKLGYKFPNSGTLFVDTLRISELAELETLKVNNLAAFNSPNENDPSFVKQLKEDRNLHNRRINLHGADGLLVELDGSLKFFAFRPTTPNKVPRQKWALRPGNRQYEYKTLINADESCTHLFRSDKDLIDCVNLCLADCQLGSTHRCHRNGSIDIVDGNKEPLFRKVVANVLDPTRTILALAAEATSSFPPASIAIKGALSVQTLAKTSKDHRSEATRGRERARKLSDSVEVFLQDAKGDAGESVVREAKRIVLVCDEIFTLLQPILNMGHLSRVLRLNRHIELIQESRHRLDVAERDFIALKDAHLMNLSRHQQTLTTHISKEMADLQRVCRYTLYLSVACF